MESSAEVVLPVLHHRAVSAARSALLLTAEPQLRVCVCACVCAYFYAETEWV